MNCPHCGATLQKNVTQCPFCGQQIHAARRHLSLGKISLSCTFAGIILIIVILIFFRVLTYRALPIAQFLANFVLLFSALSIVLGSIAFFGKARDMLGLISMMLGICFLVILALTFSLAGLIFFKTVSFIL
jgi:hypothetical protein